MVIEIMLATMCLSSAVERGFPAARCQLCDQRVLMKHKLLYESHCIKTNMPMLRELLQNCDSLVVGKAVEIYHKKKWRWKVKEPVAKKCRTEDEPVHTPKQTQKPMIVEILVIPTLTRGMTMKTVTLSHTRTLAAMNYVCAILYGCTFISSVIILYLIILYLKYGFGSLLSS